MRIAQKVCVLFMTMALTACSGGLLPSVKKTTDSPWQDFSKVKSSFDRVKPGQTTLEELHAIGFDPVRTPNVRRMSYLEVIKTFMPSPTMTQKDLDKDLRDCINVHEDCYAYEISPGVTNDKRHGNVFADMFSFHRQTTTTGWKFNALVVIQGKRVVYKVWSGEANIQRENDEKQPLGPLQNIGAHVEVAPGTDIR